MAGYVEPWKPVAGEKVRCIDDRQHIPLVIGNEYTVQWVGDYGCLELVEFPMRDIRTDRFEPIPPTTTGEGR